MTVFRLALTDLINKRRDNFADFIVTIIIIKYSNQAALNSIHTLLTDLCSCVDDAPSSPPPLRCFFFFKRTANYFCTTGCPVGLFHHFFVHAATCGVVYLQCVAHCSLFPNLIYIHRLFDCSCAHMYVQICMYKYLTDLIIFCRAYSATKISHVFAFVRKILVCFRSNLFRTAWAFISASARRVSSAQLQKRQRRRQHTI